MFLLGGGGADADADADEDVVVGVDVVLNKWLITLVQMLLLKRVSNSAGGGFSSTGRAEPVSTDSAAVAVV